MNELEYTQKISKMNEREFYSECYSVVYACHIFAEANYHECFSKRKLLQIECGKRVLKTLEMASSSVLADLSR